MEDNSYLGRRASVAFLLERGVVARQGPRFRALKLPGILAPRSDQSSVRMTHVIEDLGHRRSD